MNFSFSFQDEVPTIFLKGRLLEISDAKEIIEWVDHKLQQKGWKYLFIDLAELDYINSSGLSVFLQILTKTRKNGHDVLLKNISPKVHELLIITKLNAVFNIVNN